MTFNEIIEHCAKECCIPTYMYARLDEANVNMDATTQYPALVRAFTETITEGSSALEGRRRRRMTLYFCDAVGEVMPDTQFSVTPILDALEMRVFDFFGRVREHSVEVDIQGITPFVGQFDGLVAGWKAEVTMSYSEC